MNTIKKHWTSLLGALFVVTAFITLFQYSIEQGWITNAMKIGFGLLAGIGVSIAGVKLAQKPALVISGEITLGIGACILYATFSFAGIYYAFWEPTLLLLGMTAVTAGITMYAHRFQSRMLMNVAIAGALLSPLLLRPETDQVFTLFLYLLVLNIAFIALSIIKGWMELRIISFAGTWIMYIVYFVHFSPPMDGVWSMPIRYAIAAFLFYTVALFASSWKNKLSFDGLDLYLNAANGILFGIWALIIWNGDVEYGYTLFFISVVYLIAGAAVYKLSGRISVSAASFGLGGVLLLLMAINSLGEGILFNVIMWALYAYMLTALGAVKRWLAATILGVIIWFFLGVFWYAVTWSTPRGEWFGVYMPFLNWGALAWMMLAALGFYYARALKFEDLSAAAGRIFSRIFALLSHLIVGGLMARQIENVFTEYFDDSPKVYMGLTMSVVWAVYALILMLWGTYYRERTFRWFGAAVLVIVACKTIFMDLSGKDALFKVIVLLILGGLSFLMTWMNGKWQKPEPNPVQAETPNSQ
ncbi:DUF2339 domain-containing protein [Paenibacillus nanensis]|uniref:DUF2339 domain-containing protein n=1 Tax=Paenibacillus nanensis TaxID=393251 RepID=A0A3A1VIC4_9BACL|nr:DUF2339 domain-containing protein [Paenibacillus nanensis]RIX59366.1 DUF2339 domain-containing protein [Paenibacillus nanensis]